ncbi:hypothetical protein MLD38_039833 [Melastoma candidum]|uniref:Uncharacterized protein n=1 Tax=Melastoma candidum TaxID=119954 RepID=A0ACB9L3R8_9MYRT|nr:hypothetical protein MLD38_039833 [Melastoma candidum]
MAAGPNTTAVCLILGLIFFAASFHPSQSQVDIVFVDQGPCSLFQDCNEHCLRSGFPLGDEDGIIAKKLSTSVACVHQQE